MGRHVKRVTIKFEHWLRKPSVRAPGCFTVKHTAFWRGCHWLDCCQNSTKMAHTAYARRSLCPYVLFGVPVPVHSSSSGTGVDLRRLN